MVSERYLSVEPPCLVVCLLGGCREVWHVDKSFDRGVGCWMLNAGC
jgi:hypothetical protein